ncbi:MAG: QsdR family transcriptional regulator [Solirubrobacteraceae bacterium]|jgi:AcrR family transcriptional regulator
MAEPRRTPSIAYRQAMAGAAIVERRPTPAAAFQRARELFLAGERVDMGRLAAELGVARTTLYRWTGDRHRLLGDVAWAEVDALLGHFARTAAGTGVERLRSIAGDFLEAIAGNPSLAAFLTLEGEAGLRVITEPAGAVRPRLIAAVTRLIEEEASAGRYRPPDEPGLLADGIVSLGERFLYHAGDRAVNPDPETAKRVIGLLLREPASVRATTPARRARRPARRASG